MIPLKVLAGGDRVLDQQIIGFEVALCSALLTPRMDTVKISARVDRVAELRNEEMHALAPFQDHGCEVCLALYLLSDVVEAVFSPMLVRKW
jgi:hypothetical protein